jgi:hypothetical protein
LVEQKKGALVEEGGEPKMPSQMALEEGENAKKHK